jgi:hypothetical protein
MSIGRSLGRRTLFVMKTQSPVQYLGIKGGIIFVVGGVAAAVVDVFVLVVLVEDINARSAAR